MRLQGDPYLPRELDPMRLQLDRLIRAITTQINMLSEGHVSAATNAGTGAPTTGDWAQGDIIRNATPTVLGSPGGQYVITGWTCVASGTPGTWVATRALTGT